MAVVLAYNCHEKWVKWGHEGEMERSTEFNGTQGLVSTVEKQRLSTSEAEDERASKTEEG